MSNGSPQVTFKMDAHDFDDLRDLIRNAACDLQAQFNATTDHEEKKRLYQEVHKADRLGKFFSIRNMPLASL